MIIKHLLDWRWKNAIHPSFVGVCNDWISSAISQSMWTNSEAKTEKTGDFPRRLTLYYCLFKIVRITNIALISFPEFYPFFISTNIPIWENAVIPFMTQDHIHASSKNSKAGKIITHPILINVFARLLDCILTTFNPEDNVKPILA